jgi:pimeloyl-ACP methyl ester carboxylesterase
LLGRRALRLHSHRPRWEINIAPRRRLVLKIALVTVVAALSAGFLYEQVGRGEDARRLPRIGSPVDIGGRSFNVSCVGDGAPAVVLAAGAATPGYAWIDIQAEIARFTRACWYDRAGEGWSDPGPYPPTSAADAGDLHEALRRAGLVPPYVLVGHSLGGLDVRVYNGRFSSEVAGMVLVDASHEEEPRRAPRAYIGHTAPGPARYPLHLLFMAAARFGLLRLLTPTPPLSENASRRTREQVVEALQRRPQAIAAYSSRGLVAPDSYAEAHAAAGLDDRPLIVLTRGRPPSHPPTNDAEREGAAYELVWRHELQAQLTRLSTRGRQVIVERSGHRIPDEAPDAVVMAVHEVVKAVQAANARVSTPP